MKTFVFTFLSIMAFQAYAESSNEDFCKDYVADQKRIEKVKKYGWVDMVYDRASKEMVQSSGDNTKYLYGCLDLSWKTALYENLCKGQNKQINLPKVIYFYFEGYADFIPAKAKTWLNTVNLIGNEPHGLMTTGVEAVRNFKRELDFHTDNFDSDIEATSNDSENDTNPHELKRKKDAVYDWSRDIQFHYYSGSGTDSIMSGENAKVCYSNMQNDLAVIKKNYPKLAQPKTFIMGYSNGGVEALKFVNYFTEKKDLFIDLLITIDPIPKALGFIKNKITSGKTTFQLSKKENIGKSYNYFQSSNTKVGAGIISMQGSRVNGVDKEQELMTNHVYILSDYTIRNDVSKELTSLLSSEERN